MKSLLDVTLSVLQDCGTQCGANPFRDGITITRRVEHEGDSFLTITLPAFCSDFERSLDEGSVSPALFCRFKSAKGTCLPRFLRGFMEMVFDSDGALLSNPSTSAILCIRQICLLHKKVLLPCSGKRTSAAVVRFRKIEEEMRDSAPSRYLLRAFGLVSDIVWTNLLSRVSFADPYDHLRPRHGPGTTRENLRGNSKFAIPSWTTRLESCFPFSEFGVSSTLNPDALDRISSIPYFSPRDELPVKVCLVPKTLKTPRVIAIEPVCMQYMQQSLSDWIRPKIELFGRYTSGHVNFTDQSVNSRLARVGSIDGSLATLDMSDASDRVSCKLVQIMLRCVPQFKRYVFSCRSTRAQLPDGTVMPLRKFASMGSALCFPIESMVFFIAIVSIRLQQAACRITPSSVKRFSEDVFVYGDDLIVPVNVAPAIVVGLEDLGLRVNAAKSFWTGKFRESCGTDYYDGIDVTPIYFRRMCPSHRADVNGVVSMVSFANQIYLSGLWKTTRLLRLEVEKLLGELPSISRTTQGLGWWSFSNAQSFHAWHKDYQRVKTRCFVPVPKSRVDVLNGDPALLKCLRLCGVPTKSDHLLRSVRYGNLALKRRWI